MSSKSKVEKRRVQVGTRKTTARAWEDIAQLLLGIVSTWPQNSTWTYTHYRDFSTQILRSVSLLPLTTKGGMLASEYEPKTTTTGQVASKVSKPPRKHISKHFRQSKSGRSKNAAKLAQEAPSKPPFNLEDLSSDSPLTDVPSDIGPDPFEEEPSKVVAVKVKRPTKSPYFPNKLRPHFISCLPFPPLSETSFGLMQEKLAHDPFRLLLATIFLNKTPGERAMPVFYQLMKTYPTPNVLANANIADVTAIIHHLGFQNQRAHKCIEMAKKWVERPPASGQRVRKLHYPRKGDGKDISPDEIVDGDDPRVAWEISHLPGLGPYSHDSWRMFCRDELRGLAKSWLGEGASDPDFEPEWKRVVPTDKELRAYLTWQWLKEGWVWNKETGERHRADAATLQQAQGGGVVKEEEGKQHLVIRSETHSQAVEKPAGDFIPERGQLEKDILRIQRKSRKSKS